MLASFSGRVGPLLLLGNALLVAAQNQFSGFSTACQNIALSQDDPTVLAANCIGLSVTLDLNTCLTNNGGFLDAPGTGFTSNCDTSTCKIETNTQGIVVYNCACDNGQGFKPNGGGYNIDTIIGFDAAGILACNAPTTSDGNLQLDSFSDNACANSIQNTLLTSSGGCQSLDTTGSINSIKGILDGTPCTVILFDNPGCSLPSISTVIIESGQCVAADTGTNNFVNAVAAQVNCGLDALEAGNAKLRKRTRAASNNSNSRLWSRNPRKAKEL